MKNPLKLSKTENKTDKKQNWLNQFTFEFMHIFIHASYKNVNEKCKSQVDRY